MDDHIHAQQRVVVTASARLHLGFFDLNGTIGRRFGSMGLSLQEPSTQIELALTQDDSHKIEVADYIQNYLQRLLEYMNVKRTVTINVRSQIPRHSGLGSGTQMALAIGAGLNQLFNLNLSLQEIAALTGRGLRSGIGIGTFAAGGLVLDGGRGPKTVVPPILAQFDFPTAWRVLLIFDRTRTGTHGADEQNAFATLKDAQLIETAQNCHQLLMQALPAIKEHDFDAFSTAISQLQVYTGNYFSPVQGGLYASTHVANVLEWLITQRHHCVGQTSWGPTGFAIFENVQIAEQMLQKMQYEFAGTGLDWLLCKAKNTGATVGVVNNALNVN